MRVMSRLVVPESVDSPAMTAEPASGFARWLLRHQVVSGPESDEAHAKPQAWWKVMCLTRGGLCCRCIGGWPRESPHGQGSVAMLETLLPFLARQGVRVGVRRDVVDHHDHAVGGGRVGAHGGEPGGPRFPARPGSAPHVVLLLILGGVFLLGFSEAIGVAIPLVGPG
jgi:hypothetical protein